MGFKKNSPGCGCCECCSGCKGSDELELTFKDSGAAEIGSVILAKSCQTAPLEKACGRPFTILSIDPITGEQRQEGWAESTCPLLGQDVIDDYIGDCVRYYFNGIVSDVFSGASCAADNLHIEVMLCGDETWAGWAAAWIPTQWQVPFCFGNLYGDDKCPCLFSDCECIQTGALWFKGSAAAPQDDCDILGDTDFVMPRVDVPETGVPHVKYPSGLIPPFQAYRCNCFEGANYSAGGNPDEDCSQFADLDFNEATLAAAP